MLDVIINIVSGAIFLGISGAFVLVVWLHGNKKVTSDYSDSPVESGDDFGDGD
ncbi:MAG: hypothetical protein KDK39_10390 [Leptospiraceae bacterium]|nr:hypothetical protein [Leptospiraceae bacterium]